MNPTDSSPDLELIAALIDGRLSADERARAMKLLADSDEAVELLASSLRTQTDTPVVGVTPIAKARRRKWTVIAPIAAAAALAIVALPTLMRRGAPSDPARAYAVALAGDPRFSGALTPGWEDRWAVTRGAESSAPGSAAAPVAGSQEARAAFRLGVRSVDLQVALSRGDTALAARVASEIVETLRGIVFSDLVGASYNDLRTHLASDSRETSIDRAARAEHDLRGLLNDGLPAAYAFGQWSAAAELAARTHEASFFQSGRGAAFVRSTNETGLLPEDVAARREIGARVKQGLTDPALDDIRDTLRSLIRRRGG